MVNENQSWENLIPATELTQEDFFREWFFLEQKFGEFGVPGFSEHTLPARFPGIFGHNKTIDVKFIIYRDDDGTLLCVYSSYLENDVVRPFLLYVHPDHQRKGIASKVINHARREYFTERGHEYDFDEGLIGVKSTVAGAAWAQSYITNVLSKQNSSSSDNG